MNANGSEQKEARAIGPGRIRVRSGSAGGDQRQWGGTDLKPVRYAEICRNQSMNGVEECGGLATRRFREVRPSRRSRPSGGRRHHERRGGESVFDLRYATFTRLLFLFFPLWRGALGARTGRRPRRRRTRARLLTGATRWRSALAFGRGRSRRPVG